MYQVIGIRRLLAAYGGITALAALGFFLMWDDSFKYSIQAGLATSAVLVFVLGQTAIFPWLCRRWPAKLIFPDLDGEWKGRLRSNWPRVRKDAVPISSDSNRDRDDEALLDVPVSARFRTRLFSIAMQLESGSGYSKSHTVLVKLNADREHQRYFIHYVYENDTKEPLVTDNDRHLGAGRLNLQIGSGQDLLEGSYWTNRNWQKGLNTAGSIELVRQSKKNSLKRRQI